MNRSQIRSIECLTSQMHTAAPYSAKGNLTFNIQPLRDGFIVEGVTCPYQSHWTDTSFQVMAYVGPRGGVKNYRVLSK